MNKIAHRATFGKTWKANINYFIPFKTQDRDRELTKIDIEIVAILNIGWNHIAFETRGALSREHAYATIPYFKHIHHYFGTY